MKRTENLVLVLCDEIDRLKWEKSIIEAERNELRNKLNEINDDTIKNSERLNRRITNFSN